MKSDRRRPDERVRRRRPGRTLALVLAVVVHAAFIGFLVWSVRWQSRPPEPVTAELYAPAQKIRAPDPEPRPPPVVPDSRPAPPPPPPPPPPKAEPDQAEIALKAKREDERRAKEKAERDRKLADEKRAAEAKDRLARETEAMREAAEREARDRTAALKALADAEKARADAEKARVLAEAKARADAEARARVEAEKARTEAESKAKVQAEINARSAAQADWVRRIQSKIRGNVVLPPDLPGNPEAVFEVIQLPTGEILETQLRKSSGVKAYDEAVQRAIVKSSPLPRPDRPDLFSRTLTLRFRPLD